MAQVFLDRFETDTGFEQVGGIRMPQGMRGDFLSKVELFDNLLDGALNGRDAHRCGCLASPLVVASIGRKQQYSMAVRLPVVSQSEQGRLRQWDVAILGTFAAMDVDHHPPAVDVSDLQVEPFLQAESQRVHGPKESGHPHGRAGIEDLLDLFSSDDFRQRFDVLQFGFGERFPVSPASASEEELDAAEGNSQRAIGKLFFDFQMQQPAAKLFFGDFIGRGMTVVSQLSHGSQVAMNGSLSPTGQVQIILHLLIEFAFEELRGDG